MKIRQFIASVTTAVIFLAASINVLHADDNVCYPMEDSGYAFENCSTAPCVSPSLALGTVALVAVIGVVVHNRKHSHGSHHWHSNNWVHIH